MKILRGARHRATTGIQSWVLAEFSRITIIQSIFIAGFALALSVSPQAEARFLENEPQGSEGELFGSCQSGGGHISWPDPFPMEERADFPWSQIAGDWILAPDSFMGAMRLARITRFEENEKYYAHVVLYNAITCSRINEGLGGEVNRSLVAPLCEPNENTYLEVLEKRSYGQTELIARLVSFRYNLILETYKMARYLPGESNPYFCTSPGRRN